MSGNNFTGRLVPTIGSIQPLQTLDLSGNNFYGPVPDRLGDLYSLVSLNLSNNRFKGGFPTNLRNLQQLKFLDLKSNEFWGDVGSLFSEMRNVEYVDLSGNKFYGELFVDSSNFSTVVNTIKYINLSGNGISGGFGKSVDLFKNLEVLDLGKNKLSGTLPDFSEMGNLKILRVGWNFLYGMVPELLFETGMQLVEIDLSGNGFTGSVHSVNSTTLKVMNISSNSLSGRLPSSIGSCSTIDLSHNHLSGDLSSFENWGNTLEVLDLSSNLLSGNCPNVTTQLTNLVSIQLHNNSITGSLPSALGLSPRLTVVDFSLNKLNGSILPSLFASLTLTHLNLSKNQLGGTIPIHSSHSTESLVLSSYPHLETLDLSENALTGPLPPEISRLQRLKLLDVHTNSLSGELPKEITKLNELEYVDLSDNKFAGMIPDMAQSGLKQFNISKNDLSGTIPRSLIKFPDSSFHPGNNLLIFPGGTPTPSGRNNSVGPDINGATQHKRSKSSIRVAVILVSIGAALLIVFLSIAFYKLRSQEICGNYKFKDRNAKLGRVVPPNMFRSTKDDALQTSMSFSNDHLLTSASRSMSGQKELLTTEIVEYGFADPKDGNLGSAALAGRTSFSDSHLSTSPRLVDPQPVKLDVYSPDRLVGEFFFLDNSLIFTAEELSRAPAEVLGRSSHGTSYKATLDNGHVLTVKWLRVGLVKHKKDFAKEAKRVGTIGHPNIVPWRGYYWGPKEQERLIVSDYIYGESLALYLYESTPRRYSRLSVAQRLKIAIDVARCLHYLHQDRSLPHGDLKPSNILLTGPTLSVHLTDYGLHRLLTPSGISEQCLNLGALGYRAPELAEAAKPLPSYKADVYAFGVILMELLTRRSAGDIISGQSGAVDLTDWVQMCCREGRGNDCFDRDINGLEEASRVMDELLAVSLKCILPVNERPNIKTVVDDLSSITV